MGDDLNPDSTVICPAPSLLMLDEPSNDARVAQGNAQGEGGPSDATASSWRMVLEDSPADSDAHEALATIYARGGRWSELAELHAKRFDAIDNRHERAALLRSIASILREKFDDDSRAFEVLLDAFREDFADDETVRDLEAAARWTDRFGELLVAANDWLRDATIDGNARVALLARVGRWYGDDLGKPAWGMPYLEEARALAPNDLRVLRALVKVHTAAGAIAACEPILRRLLEIDATDREAADALERILLGRDAIYDLVAFLEQRVRDSGSAALNGLRLKLSSLHGALPGGGARAYDLLEEAHSLDPDDLEVLRALDSRCVLERHWGRLAAVLEERIERAETEDERLDLLVRLAGVYEDEHLDPDRAAQRLEQVVELAPQRDEAFVALQRCYGKLRLWDAAVFAYERHIDASAHRDARIAAYLGMARVLLDELDLDERALEAFGAALDLDPQRTSILESIARVHERRGDLPRALAVMEDAVRLAGNPASKLEALCRLAATYRTRAADSVRARALYRDALDLDPTNLTALSALRQLALEIGDVVEAARLLDREQRHTPQPQTRAKLLVELALIRRERLDDPHGATCALEEAHAADPENEDAALAIAAECVERRAWSVVEPLLEKLTRSAGRRPIGEQQRIHIYLGRAHAARGESARALEAFRRANKLGADDLEVWSGIAEAAFHAEEYAAALDAQKRIIAGAPNQDRVGLLHRLGEIHLRLGDARRARIAFERAIAVDGADRTTLRALIERLVALESDRERRARYRMTAAQMHRDLGDDEQALDHLDAALEDDPSALVAFRAIEEILTVRSDYPALERAYRKMILRARGLGDSKLDFQLWHALGVIYRDRLNDPRAGLEAFRTASRLRPDDSHERRIIAELCVATDRTDLAIAELREAIAREPLEVSHHQALYRLHARTGELDRAFCVASALVFLKGADAEQRACYMELRPKGVPDFRARLGRAAWIRDLAHPALDRAVGGVFEVIARGAKRLKKSTVMAAAAENPNTTQRLAAKAFFGAAAVLGMEPPQLWVRPDLSGGITAVPVEPAGSVMGASLLSGWSVPELMFVFGKHLAVQQGEHAVRAHDPAVSELQALLLAAVKIARPALAIDSPVRKALERELRVEEVERLRHVVSSMVDIGASADVTRWVECSELTAVRAGLLLCADLSVAAKILRQVPVVAGDLSPNEKVKELVRFAVSEAYHQLRRSLGIDVRARNVGAFDDDDEPTLDRKLCA